MIDKILRRQEFLSKPPVLLDIGASGGINKKWSPIAKYSVCIACDADSREFGFVSNCKDYKKLFIINKICKANDKDRNDFYLTRSPYCSSTLMPDTEKLANWEFSSLFDVVSCSQLPSMQMADLQSETGITYVDYFKTDSQGTDLRLFTSLCEDVRRHVLAAEFEPGIMDAYKGEDKLAAVLSYMEDSGFWVSGLTICGVKRIRPELFTAKEKKLLYYIIPKSPGWGEFTFLTNLEDSIFTIREYLLAWIFAFINKQYGFSMEIISKGKEKFSDEIWDELYDYTQKTIKEEFRHLFTKRIAFFIHRWVDKLFKTNYIQEY